MKNIPGGHNLFVQDKEVASKIENVYSVSAPPSPIPLTLNRGYAIDVVVVKRRIFLLLITNMYSQLQIFTDFVFYCIWKKLNSGLN